MTCGELPLFAIDCKATLLGMLDGKLPSDNGSTTLPFATETFGGDCKLGDLLPNCPPASASAFPTNVLLPFCKTKLTLEP